MINGVPRDCVAGRVLILALALTVTACASTSGAKKDGDPLAVGAALSQPFRDLNLMRTDPAAALEAARAAPYRRPDPAGCADVATEIGALTAALGPDIDEAKNDDESLVGEIARGAVGGLVELPFRGIVRRVSGARKRESEERRAVIAGMARRSFLKGHQTAMNCAAAATAAAPTNSP